MRRGAVKLRWAGGAERPVLRVNERVPARSAAKTHPPTLGSSYSDGGHCMVNLFPLPPQKNTSNQTSTRLDKILFASILWYFYFPLSGTHPR